jgi:hypothetical protein
MTIYLILLQRQLKMVFSQLKVPNFGANRAIEQTWYCSKGNGNKVFEKKNTWS